MMALILGGETIEYVVKRSARARRLRLTIQADGELIITVPARVSLERIETLLRPYTDWILRQRAKMRMRTVQHLPAISDHATYRAQQYTTKKLVMQCLEKLSSRVVLPPHTVQIKNHRTRWGSCSRQGNLNFNYRLVYLPIELAEYIVVHEVCHLFEMNHSIRFWKQVAELIPDYAVRRKQLHNYSWKKS